MEAVTFVHEYLAMPPTATLRAADDETVRAVLPNQRDGMQVD